MASDGAASEQPVGQEVDHVEREVEEDLWAMDEETHDQDEEQQGKRQQEEEEHTLLAEEKDAQEKTNQDDVFGEAEIALQGSDDKDAQNGEADPEDALPSSSRLQAEIAQFLVGRDLENISLKELRAELEHNIGLATGTLDACREEITEIASKEINRMLTQDEDPASDAAPEAATPEKKERRKKRKRKHGHRNSDNKKPKQQKRARNLMFPSDEPMTREELFHPDGLAARIGDTPIELHPRVFKAGGCGFWATPMLNVMIGGKPREIQCMIQCAVIGSREWDLSEKQPPAAEAISAANAHELPAAEAAPAENVNELPVAEAASAEIANELPAADAALAANPDDSLVMPAGHSAMPEASVHVNEAAIPCA